MQIKDIINRRADLSAFLVHLTRDTPSGPSAHDNLKSIIESGRIEARSIYGHLRRRLEEAGMKPPSQHVVCFTETPLEFTSLVVEEIDGRTVQFRPYGIAITKKIGRQRGANPVWYVDITPGHGWLANNLDNLVDSIIAGGFRELLGELAKIMPFIEQMGTGSTYCKEFWWEREWRHVGAFTLPRTIVCLCPEEEIDEFSAHLKAHDIRGPCIDPRWSLERMVAHLSGFTKADTEIL